jgi:hypothetical protein
MSAMHHKMLIGFIAVVAISALATRGLLGSQVEQSVTDALSGEILDGVNF